jgi:predicted ATPase/class 3 adenylate cyclase
VTRFRVTVDKRIMSPMRGDLPPGTVTFLFTDIEGSTKLLHELGAEAYAEALAEHRRVLRDAFTDHGGVEVDTQGDAFFIAFPTAPGAVQAATQAQKALAGGPIRVRMGLHTGTPHLTEEGYVGEVVHEGARIAAVGHGGQVLLSRQTLEFAQVDVTDLGEHRLKDIDAPVAIFQLGPARFPPLKTISNTNLPHPASSFVGREREVQEVASMFRESARLLTLTGPGGTGKTRLAIEAASELVPRFKAGVFWVELAPLRDPALVFEEIAKTLGVTDDLAAHISEREMLLVLDNLEQVIEAAPELAALVENCPNLALLVTSREVLRVRGEVEYPVAPLADPDAVELFCARARAEPEEAVRELCRALDNLPLALELAAARASLLSPEQILERLSGRLDLFRGGRDADPRQQTLRATIAWSYELLSPAEQRLFARLAVFVGGCTLQSAEDVADADLETLGSLVDKSLLRRAEERFWMLETIREYATERLEDADAEALRRRHAEHFLALAEEAEPSLLGVSPGGWLDRLERDHDNLRAALDWLKNSQEGEMAMMLAGDIWEFWCLRGHAAEGWRRLEDLLRADERPTMGRAKALTGAAHLAPETPAGAASFRPRAEQALALHRELGDDWGIAYAEYQYGLLFSVEGDFATALPLVEKSVRRLRELGDEHRALQAMRVQAWCHEELGDLARAQTLREDMLRGARAAHDDQMEARALAILAGPAIDEGRSEDAIAMMKDAYRLDRGFGDPSEIAVDLIRFARVFAFAERAEAAVILLSSADVMHEELGLAHPTWITALQEEAEQRARARLDDAAYAEAWGHGRNLTADEAVAFALDSWE